VELGGDVCVGVAGSLWNFISESIIEFRRVHSCPPKFADGG